MRLATPIISVCCSAAARSPASDKETHRDLPRLAAAAPGWLLRGTHAGSGPQPLFVTCPFSGQLPTTPAAHPSLPGEQGKGPGPRGSAFPLLRSCGTSTNLGKYKENRKRHSFSWIKASPDFLSQSQDFFGGPTPDLRLYEPSNAAGAAKKTSGVEGGS